jgi:hypothetical protein
MRTETESRKGYQIEVVEHFPGWVANIYPESPKAPPLNSALPPIICATKDEALTRARERIDEHV